MTTPRRVTCVLVNETSISIIATGSSLNYKIEKGALQGTMPCPIEASSKATFTLAQADGETVGPAGWACYELKDKSLVYQISFGDPAQGAKSFEIGLNYLEKLGDAVTSVKFAGPSGPIEDDKVAGEMDLTVEYHLDFKDTPQPPAADPNADAQASRPVAGSPGGAASVVLPPYFARWNQKGITQKRKKVLAAIYKLYPLLWQDKSAPAQAVAAVNGGTGLTTGNWRVYANQGPWSGPGTSCTSSCPMIGRAVSPLTANHWTYKAYNNKAGWTPWGSAEKKMPSVGDVYILVRDEMKRPKPPPPSVPAPDKNATAEQQATPAYQAAAKAWKDYYNDVALHYDPHERHVGIIVQVPTSPSEIFITADGGQTAYGVQAAHLVQRGWSKRAPGPTDSKCMEDWKTIMNGKDLGWSKPKDGIDCIYVIGGAESKTPTDANRLVGWIDIDQIEFGSDAFDEQFTEADYNAMGERIDSVMKAK